MNHQELFAYKDLVIGKKRVAGDLASWAVQQSPYAAPDNLALVVKRLQEIWPHEEFHKFESMAALREELDAAFLQIPELLAWNERKNGNKAEFGITSRYSQPSPDDDFIDLGALSRNVASSAWADAVEFAKFNDEFERKRTQTRLQMPNPSDADVYAADFEAIWRVTRHWDVGVRDYYVGYCGMNGSHVMLILNELRKVTQPGPPGRSLTTTSQN